MTVCWWFGVMVVEKDETKMEMDVKIGKQKEGISCVGGEGCEG